MPLLTLKRQADEQLLRELKSGRTSVCCLALIQVSPDIPRNGVRLGLGLESHERPRSLPRG
jgi:hypothetical protein